MENKTLEAKVAEQKLAEELNMMTDVITLKTILFEKNLITKEEYFAKYKEISEKILIHFLKNSNIENAEEVVKKIQDENAVSDNNR